MVEAVGGGQAGGGELPEGGGGLELGEAGEALQVGGEGGALRGEQGAEGLGFGGERLREDGFVDGLGGEGVVEEVGGVAEVEGDGRGGGGDDSSWGTSLPRGPCRMRGDPAPGEDAGEAEVVEPLGGVVGDAGGKEGALPLDGRGFEALQLLNRCEDGFFAGGLRVGG